MASVRETRANWRERENTKAPKEVKSLHLSRSANGGHIVEHHFDNSGPGAYKEPESHTFGKSEGKKMLAHVGKMMGCSTSDEE